MKDMQRRGSLETIAACTGCGRGYVHIHHDGVRCITCGSPVRLLPTPEIGWSDDADDRERWKAIVKQLPELQP